MISLFTRFVIIVTVVIALSDIIILGIHRDNPLTWSYIALLIVITIIPIVVNLWYWLIFKKQG